MIKEDKIKYLSIDERVNLWRQLFALLSEEESNSNIEIYFIKQFIIFKSFVSLLVVVSWKSLQFL